MGFSLQFNGRRHKLQTGLAVQRLSDSDSRTSHEQKLSDKPRTLTNNDEDRHWDRSKWAVYLTGDFTCGPGSDVYRGHRIS